MTRIAIPAALALVLALGCTDNGATGDGGTPGDGGCRPTSCAAAGKSCGTIPDGCGGTVACGACPTGQTCGGGGSANVCGVGTCTPTTCAAAGKSCGTISDGCSGTLDCGGCAAPATCGGGGTANACGCTPATCAGAGKNCGTMPDGCGGTLSCGACGNGQTCGGGGVANVCGAGMCTSTTCAAQGKDCGAISDGCAGTLACGMCAAPASCGGGGAPNVCGCTPTTCAAQGKNCGAIADGCGGMLACGGCAMPDTCGGGGTANVCGNQMNLYVLPADRAAAWRPGVTYNGGIPARATICKTLKPSGADDTSAIQSAIEACPAGQTVLLAAGKFTIGEGNYVLLDKSNVTLRGSGAGVTVLTRTGGAMPNQEAPGANPSPHVIVGPARWNTDAAGSTNLTADAPKGATAVTVASTTGFTVGQYVLLDELSGAAWQTDPQGRGKIWASSDFRVVWQLHNPGLQTDDPLTAIPNPGAGNPSTGGDAAAWFSRQDRPTAEIKQITAINGKTITFATATYIDYRASHTAQLSYYNYPFVEGAGVESMTMTHADNGQLRFQLCAGCWAKGVENTVWHDEGFAIDSSYRVEVRDSYVHDAAWPQPGGAGYAFSLSAGSSEILLENDISVMANKVMVARSAGAGSVVGYNYIDDGFINTNGNWVEIGLNASHMVGPHHVLFEGNYGFNFDSDHTHGNSIYHTVFRNWLRGVRRPFVNPMDGQTYDDATQNGNGPLRCAGGMAYSYWMSYVGNVLGAQGKMGGFVYDATGPNNFSQSAIWMLGWDGWDPYPYDGQVEATAIRDGNWDWVQAKQSWHNAQPATLPASLYLPQNAQPPPFFGANPFPWVDPTTGKTFTLPAKARFDAGTPNVVP